MAVELMGQCKVMDVLILTDSHWILHLQVQLCWWNWSGHLQVSIDLQRDNILCNYINIYTCKVYLLLLHKSSLWNNRVECQQEIEFLLVLGDFKSMSF